MKRRRFLAVASGAATTLGGCSVLGDAGDDPCDGAACDVGMTRNAFVPEEYEIATGDAVVWKNTSSADHTVTAYDEGVPDGADYFATGGYANEGAARDAWSRSRGGRLGPRETFEHTFQVPGTYSYVCLPHESAGMVGTVVVTE